MNGCQQIREMPENFENVRQFWKRISVSSGPPAINIFTDN